MTTIKSKVVTVNQSPEEVFTFLRNLNNLEKLMPEDRVKDWNSDENQCSFQIKGLAKIGMTYNSEVANEHLKFVSSSDKPFPFTLNIFMKENGDKSDCNIVFEGEMNAMLSMMAKTPLTNFFNMLADKLKEINE